MDQVLRDSLSPERFRTWLLGCFAVAATLLAMLGVGGLLAYDTAQHGKEFGLRVDLLSLILWRYLRLSGAGIAIGMVSLFVAKAIATLLYDTSPPDPSIFAAVSLTLTLFALAGAVLPIGK